MNVLSLGTTAAFYGLVLPLIMIQLLALLYIPSLMVPGAKPFAVGKAIYCFLLQTLGVVLMSLGGLVAMYGVIEQVLLQRELFSTQVYLGLLLAFTLGGLTYLWHENLALAIEEPSRRVTAAIFWFTIKSIGYLMSVFSLLALLLTMLLFGNNGTELLVLPFLLFCYGMLLSWCTRDRALVADRVTVAKPMPVAAKQPVPFVKKPEKKGLFGKKKPAAKPSSRRPGSDPQVFSV